MISFDTATNGGIATATSLTWSHTCTGSNTELAVSVLVQTNSDTVSGITYNTVAMTRATTVSHTAPNRRQYLYLLTAPTTGAHNVLASTSNTTIAGLSASYAGCQQTGQPSEVNQTDVTSGSSITTSIGGLASGSWIVGCVVAINESGSSYTVGANTTSRVLNTGGFSLFQIIDSNAASTTSLVYRWTGSDNALMCVAEILEQASSSETPTVAWYTA